MTANPELTVWYNTRCPVCNAGCYLLPVKAAVRQGEKIGHGDQVACLIELAKTA